MAQSQEVNANNAALASQYNNLRKDVLDPSLGHTHQGTTDTGNKVDHVNLLSKGTNTHAQIDTHIGTAPVQSFAHADGPWIGAQTWTDVPGSTCTITSTGEPILVICTLRGSPNSGGHTIGIRFLVDGTVIQSAEYYQLLHDAVVYMWTPAAGSHNALAQVYIADAGYYFVVEHCHIAMVQLKHG